MEYIMQELNIKHYRDIREVPYQVEYVETIYLPEYELDVFIDANDYDLLQSMGHL